MTEDVGCLKKIATVGTKKMNGWNGLERLPPVRFARKLANTMSKMNTLTVDRSLGRPALAIPNDGPHK
jgi:hypothetical protein